MTIQQDEIISHALSSASNLELTLMIGQSYDTLRSKIIQNFASYFQEKLQSAGWETEFKWWLEAPLGNYTGFYCRRKNWPPQLQLLVESKGTTGKYIYAVLKDTDTLTHELFVNNLNMIKGKGKQSKICVWYQDLSTRFYDFTQKETLCLLYEKAEFAEYLLAEIESLGSLIDEALLAKGIIHDR
ncbi:MAG TPA: hypothetical protein PKI88_02265 [Agitococcus sp.]|nr:hypothetical protein [Agitococcus sp.]HMY82333.1 hypothetical protein [Agitococcus sp.]HNC02886.1 hypothetical protein [Agitococcus sp.]HNC85847.1 hypothetical protein [Agitococcus sp.]HNG10389.1 hypothetical protein [Agitococcus sp.]